MTIIIAENSNVFNFFNEKKSILSSSLIKLEFYDDSKEGLIIRFYLSLVYPLNKIISLEFYEIIEYSFFLSTGYPYNIESYKFFENSDGFYISIDPFSEDQVVSEEDNNFILAKKVRVVERTNNNLG